MKDRGGGSLHAVQYMCHRLNCPSVRPILYCTYIGSHDRVYIPKLSVTSIHVWLLLIAGVHILYLCKPPGQDRLIDDVDEDM
jgi:hypothetical protein